MAFFIILNLHVQSVRNFAPMVEEVLDTAKWQYGYGYVEVDLPRKLAKKPRRICNYPRLVHWYYALLTLDPSVSLYRHPTMRKSPCSVADVVVVLKQCGVRTEQLGKVLQAGQLAYAVC